MKEERPLRAHADVALGRQRSPQHRDGPNLVPYLRAANVKDGRLQLSDVKKMNFTPNEQTIYRLRPGDVLVSEGSGSLSAVGASAVWDGEIDDPVCFQNTLLRMRPKSETTDARFLAWWSSHAFNDGLYASLSTGANIYHLSAERVRSLPVRFPEPEKQRAIADFLDAETARIDTLITKKQGLQESLGERRLSLARAAMEGSWVPGRRQPSPVPWLASVPAGWRCASVGMTYGVQLGLMLNEERVKGPHLRPYLRNANVGWGEIAVDDVAEMDFPPAIRKRYRLKEGDLLVCEGGAGVAEAAVWGAQLPECYYQKSLHRVRPAAGYPVEWLAEWLRLWKAVGASEAAGNLATIPHLTAEQLKSHVIPLPPPNVCEQILERLTRESHSIAACKGRLSRQIELLRERRRALITAAVTGEMAVPGVAAA